MRKRPWHSASSVHLGPRCRLGRKLPKERGRGTIDGLSYLGPPPGLMSRRMKLVDPRRHRTTGVQRQSQESVKAGKWGAIPDLPLTRPLTLGRDLGPLAQVYSSIQKESIKPCLWGTGGDERKKKS